MYTLSFSQCYQTVFKVTFLYSLSRKLWESCTYILCLYQYPYEVCNFIIITYKYKISPRTLLWDPLSVTQLVTQWWSQLQLSDTKAVFLYYRSNGSLVAILVDEKGFCDSSTEEDSVGLTCVQLIRLNCDFLCGCHGRDDHKIFHKFLNYTM